MKENFFKYTIFTLLIIILKFTYICANVTYMSVGYGHTIYRCADDVFYSWGSDNYSELQRLDIYSNKKTPQRVNIQDNIKTFDAGKGQHNLALCKDGKVLAWGRNSYGQLGNGEECGTSNSFLCNHGDMPIYVKGGETGTEYLENVISVSAGLWQSFAVLKSGEVVGWGANVYGQLGVGHENSAKEPMYVVKKDGSRLTNIKKVSTGYMHSYALTLDGEIWAWGFNNNYQLGVRDNMNFNYAIMVLDTEGNKINNIIDIAAGESHGLFLRNDGKVYGLGLYKGSNYVNNRQTYTALPYPTLVNGGDTGNEFLENVVSIATGHLHSAVIVKENDVNKMLSWGDNWSPSAENPSYPGLLAIGSEMLQSHQPRYVVDINNQPIENVLQIALGHSITLIELYSISEKRKKTMSAGVNANGEMGTGGAYNYSIYLQELNISNCSPLCPYIMLEKESQYCTPFKTEIETNLPTHYYYKWKKDNISLFYENNNKLEITSGGAYYFEAIDTDSLCPSISGNTKIIETFPNFIPLEDIYCGDTLTFNAFGDVEINWYNNKNAQLPIASGNQIVIPKTEAQIIVQDSIYRMWIKTPECQPIPVYNYKLCNDCYTPPPTVRNTTLCHLEDVRFLIEGQNLRWFDSNTMKLEHLDNIYSPELDIPFSKQMKVIQYINHCPSQAVDVSLTVEICLPKYDISGRVHLDNKRLPNCKVIVYDAENIIIPIDTVETNNNGEFKINTYAGSKYIAALPTDNNYLKTWYGNKTSEHKAYLLKLDTDVRDIDIYFQNIETANLHLEKEDCISNNYIIRKNEILNLPLTRSIELFDIQSNNIINIDNSKQKNINFNYLERGIYFLKYATENTNCISKIFVY